MTKLILVLSVGLLFVIGLALATSTDDRSDAKVAAPTSDQAGYFRDDSGNRIKTFMLKPGATPEQVLAHARRETKTPGRIFAAYYYEPGSRVPAVGVTLAADHMTATDVIHEAPRLDAWRFVYMMPLIGAETFVDCEANPTDDLCRL